jgi:hypothetical protein
MLKSSASTRWIIRTGIVLAALTTLVVACVSHDNPRPKCNELADGGVVLTEAGSATDVPPGSAYYAVPTTDAQTPEMLGVEPDPGPACTDCTQADDVDVLLIHDFEQGFAPTWFNYGEPGIAITPPQVGPGIGADGGPANVPPPYWGLQVPDLNVAPGGMRCGSKHALHMAGGRFLSWGGGYVSLSVTIRGPANVQRYCPGDLAPEDLGIGTQPMANGDTCNFFITPAAGQQSRLGMDVSDYEGISFWARRSPGGQSTLRIAVNDENTAQGLALEVERNNYLAREEDPTAAIEEPNCKRVQDCCRHCNEVERDAPVLAGATIVGTRKVTEKRCWLPGERKPPELQEVDGVIQFKSYPEGLPETAWAPPGAYHPTMENTYRAAYDDWERFAKLCCPPTMEDDEVRASYGDTMTKLGDPQFGGRGCNPYVFQFDYSSGYFCWDPGNPPLPERNENRCDDGFESNLVVDTEWRFYKIPWSELRRFTPNRKPVDTTGIFSVALFFGQGYLDTYVDDIGFYRKRR